MHQYPFNNNVRAVLHNAVGAADTQIDVVKAVAPYKDAPDTSVSQPLGILSLTDSLSVPTKFEIVHYDNRIDNGTYWSYMGVIRSRDGTSAQTFAAGNPVTQNVTSELLELPPPLYVTNDAGGSVGIGVESPTEKLDVDGSVSSSVGYMFTAEEDIGGAFAGSGIVLDWSTSHAKKATGIGNSTLDPMIDPSKPCRLQLLIEDTEVISPVESSAHVLLREHLDAILGTLGDRGDRVVEDPTGARPDFGAKTVQLAAEDVDPVQRLLAR